MTMKTSVSFIIAIIFLFSMPVFIFGQSLSKATDCSEFYTMMDEARDEFDLYWGDFIYDDGMEEVYDYEFSLWDDEEHYAYVWYEGNPEMYFVEFYYNTTYHLEEAYETYLMMADKVRGCLPEGYYLYSDRSEYYEYFNEFIHEDDSADPDYPAHPVVEVAVVSEESQYYVMITVYAPEVE